METLDEVEDLVNQFVISQHFQSVDAMLLYVKSLNEIHLQENCHACVEKANASGTVTDKEYSEPVKCNVKAGDLSGSSHKPALPSYSGISLEKATPGRKSRRSVCVPTLRFSSSDNDEDENDDASSESDADENDDAPDNGKLCDDSNSGSDNEVFVKGNLRKVSKSSPQKNGERPIQKTNVKDCTDIGSEDIPHPGGSINMENVVDISSADETPYRGGSHIPPSMSRNNDTSDSECSPISENGEDSDSDYSPVIGRKKNTRRIASSSNESGDNESGDNTSKNNACRVSVSSESESETDTKASLAKSRDSQFFADEASESDSSVSQLVHSIKKLDVFSVDSSSDDDFEDQKNVKQTKYKKSPLKTPKSNIRDGEYPFSKKTANVMTPKSSIRRILNTFPTPSSVPGTPAYKRHFNSKREGIVKDLFVLYNDTVFDNRLPKDFEIIWNKRMTKTAGFCYLLRTGTDRKSRVELSDKVIDTVERIRDTLIHELCHAATWIFEGKKGHGLEWKYWAKRANRIHPDLPVVTTCHNYDIQTKYKFQCDGCGHVFGRHSKSIDPDKHRCGSCGGRPLLLSAKGSASGTPKLNAYASYVKENFSAVKKANPALPTKELMKKIGEHYRIHKNDQSNKENIGSVS